MEPVRPAGSGFFPLDEELALLPGSLTPIQQDHLVHLGAVMPFAQAAKMLETLLGVQVSEATVRRMTEQAGTGYEQVQLLQSQHVQAQEQPASPAWFYAQEKPVPVAGKAVLSSDGAYVPLSTGEWAEVRTLAIGQVQSHTTAQGEEQFKVSHLSYFSRMSTAEAFETLCEGELHRRGIRHVAQVCAVTDGAIWLQHFIDLHRPDALRILDFPHAAEYVNAIGEGVRQAGRHLPKQWLEGVLHRLKHQGPERVLHHLSRLCEWCHDPEVEKKRRYLCTRQNLMHYPTYRAAGWPIGSGMVESANKLVMQTRLKGPGMRWEPTHVNPMLALRTAVCNDQWSEAWSLIQQQRHHQQEQKRQQQAIPRLTELVASTLLLLLRFRPPLPRPVPAEPAPKASPRPAEPAATLPGSWRPSAHHIWKCTPACRPKLVAKK
jgi:hypothetical protein